MALQPALQKRIDRLNLTVTESLPEGFTLSGTRFDYVTVKDSDGISFELLCVDGEVYEDETGYGGETFLLSVMQQLQQKRNELASLSLNQSF